MTAIMDKTPHSLRDLARTRSAGRIFASDFISFFDGREPIGIIQFRLKQKSAPVESKIFECIWEADVRRQLADGLSPFKS